MIGSGKSPTNLEAMSLNYWNIVDLDVISQVMQWIRSQVWSEINDQTTYEACDDNLDARI